jgi:hypothetical protein
VAPENRGYHVDAGEAAVLARSASVASCLRLAAANLMSIAPELLVRSGCLWAGRRFLHFRGGRGRHLLRDTASISYAGLKQLGDCSLFRLEQFSRPLQPFKSFGQGLDLLIMRLDFFLDRGGFVVEPFSGRYL